MPSIDEWVRPQALAERLGVTRLTIYRWIDDGRVDVKRISRSVILVKLRADAGEKSSVLSPQPSAKKKKKR